MGEDLSALRIGYIPRCANPRVAADVAANTRAALDAWAAMGATVEEVTDAIDWIEYEGRVLYQANFAVFCAPFLPQWQNRMDPVTLAFMERGAQFTLADFRNAEFARTRLFRAMQALFDRYDVLVTPTMARTALPADFDAANDDVIIDGEACGITRQGWTSPQYPFNLTGPSRRLAALGLRRRRPADRRAGGRALGRGGGYPAARRPAGTRTALGGSAARAALASRRDGAPLRRPGCQGRSITRLRKASTTIALSGPTTQVDSRSSIRAGPCSCVPVRSA